MPSPKSNARGDGFDVLVIDDSEIARSLIAGQLEDAGLSVLELPGPIGATRAVLTHGIKVVVTDVNMPALPGNNLIRLFQNNPTTDHVRVVLVSDLPDSQLATLGHESSAHGVVQKGRIETDLVPLVRNLLRR